MQERTGYAFILGFVGFVTSFGAHIVNVNLPIYAQQVGVGVAVIGLIIAVYDFAEIVAKPIFGALADKAGGHCIVYISFTFVSLDRSTLTHLCTVPPRCRRGCTLCGFACARGSLL